MSRNKDEMCFDRFERTLKENLDTHEITRSARSPNQNDIRSVEDIVREFGERFAHPDKISALSHIKDLTLDGAGVPVDVWLRTQITALLTHLKGEIEGKKWKLPPHHIVALQNEREQYIYNEGRREGENTAKDEDIALIDSLIHPIQ